MKISDVLAPEYRGPRPADDGAEDNGADTHRLPVRNRREGRTSRPPGSEHEVGLQGQQPVAIQGIARDVTDRRRTEQALQETQTFFHSFMNNSPAVAFMKDEEGRYVYVNEPFERVFGRKLSFLRGKTSFDWLPPGTAKQTHENDLEILAMALRRRSWNRSRRLMVHYITGWFSSFPWQTFPAGALSPGWVLTSQNVGEPRRNLPSRRIERR